MGKKTTKNKINPTKKAAAKLISPEVSPLDTYIQNGFLLLIFLLPLVVRLKLSVFISPFISIGTISTGMHASYFSYYKWIILIILTLLIIGLFITKLIASQYRIQPSYINLPLAVLAVIIPLSTLMADHKMIALTGYYDQHDGAITYLACLLLMLIAANTHFTEKFGRRLTMVLGTVTIIMAILSLVNYMGIDLTQNSTVRILLAGREYAGNAYGFLSSTLGNRNYSSGLAAALLCYFLALLVWGKYIIHPICTILFTISAIVLLLTSLSSSGIVAAFIGLFMLILLGGYDLGFKRIALVSSVVIILLVLSFSYLSQKNPQLVNEVFFWKGYLSDEVKLAEQISNPSAGSGRVYIWKKTAEFIANQPLLGHGANTLAYYFPHTDFAKDIYSEEIVDKTHNAYLGFAFNFGIIALLFLLYLLTAHLWLNGKQIIKGKGKTGFQRIYQIALLSFLLSFWVQGLFNDFVIGSAPIHWLLLGFGISLYHSRAAEQQLSTNPTIKK